MYVMYVFYVRMLCTLKTLAVPNSSIICQYDEFSFVNLLLKVLTSLNWSIRHDQFDEFGLVI